MEHEIKQTDTLFTRAGACMGFCAYAILALMLVYVFCVG